MNRLPHVTNLPELRRRRRRAVPIVAAAGVVAVVAAGVVLARSRQDPPVPFAVAPLPSASPGVVRTDYVGYRWRLTAVTDARGTTTIPASVDAWLEMTADGELLASDDVNVTNARFTRTTAGFDVSDPIISLVGYAGDDPARLAAITGIDAMVTGVPAMAASSPPVEQLGHVTVRSADRETLELQAHGVRLTFVRRGPVQTQETPAPSIAGSAPSR